MTSRTPKLQSPAGHNLSQSALCYASGVVGSWRQVEQCPVLVAFEEFIESLHETLHGN